MPGAAGLLLPDALCDLQGVTKLRFGLCIRSCIALPGFYLPLPASRLVWGSQTTITEPVSTWRSLLLETARSKKTWFRELLGEVCEELAKEQYEPENP